MVAMELLMMVELLKMVAHRWIGPVVTRLPPQGLKLAALVDQTRQHRPMVQAIMEREIMGRMLLRQRLTDHR